MPLPIRILYVTDHHRLPGGSEKRLLSLARNLDPEVYQLHYCTLSESGDLHRALDRIGVPAYALGVRRGFDYPNAAKRLHRIVRSIRPDILHGQQRFGSLLGAMIGRLCRVPVVLGTRTYTTKGKMEFLDWIAARLVDHMVTVSRAAADVLEERLRVVSSKITIIPNGVDLREMSPPATKGAAPNGEGLTIVCVGNLHSIKGHEWAIRALPLVHEVKPDVRLKFVGDGVLRSNLELLAGDLGVSGHVHFTGTCADVLGQLVASDVFLIPSLSEGMSNALLEAMAAGLPVIATRVGGNPEVVGAAGILVSPGSAEAIAEAIVELAQNAQERQRLGELAARRVQDHFSLSATISAHDQLYRHMFENPTRRQVTR